VSVTERISEAGRSGVLRQLQNPRSDTVLELINWASRPCVFRVYSDLESCEVLRLNRTPPDTREFEARLEIATPDTWECPETFSFTNRGMPKPDYEHLAPLVCFLSARGVQCLDDLLSSAALFPLNCDEGEYYVVRLPRVSGALDLGRSSVSWMDRKRQTLSNVYYWEFHPERLEGLTFFRMHKIWFMTQHRGRTGVS